MLLVVAVLSLVVYRVTRFLIEDSLIDEPRTWLTARLSRPKQREPLPGKPMVYTPTLNKKLLELMECPYCVSVWVAAGAVALASWTWSVPQPFWTWLAVAGLAVAIYVKIED